MRSLKRSYQALPIHAGFSDPCLRPQESLKNKMKSSRFSNFEYESSEFLVFSLLYTSGHADLSALYENCLL